MESKAKRWCTASGVLVDVRPTAGYSVKIEPVDADTFMVRVVKDPPGVLDCLSAAYQAGGHASGTHFLTCPVDRCEELRVAMTALATRNMATRNMAAERFDLRSAAEQMAAGDVLVFGVPVFPGTRFGSGTFAPEQGA